MNVGMLWFDNDPRASLDVKVERAVVYYRNKYGKTPTLCFVHPSMLPNGTKAAEQNSDGKENDKVQAGGMEVRTHRSVLPNHFWIGMRT